MSSILDPAPSWQAERSEYQTLWHGCTLFDKNSIERKGIDLAKCRVDADFGRGFYTTTLERQARYWAVHRFTQRQARHQKSSRNGAVVLRFRVRRYATSDSSTVLDQGLDGLLSLSFVLGDYDSEDYWSLVQHCRQSRPRAIRSHLRPPDGWYDMVTGPVAAFWVQRTLMHGGDQVSFHTPRAVNALNALIVTGDPECYRWEAVTLP